ncbi:YdaS family helix-turn-helix protein [Xenorhabdus khoisanae]|uniref:XRE family transcriptional regulator n=1 Tax=Xenorhabdus khoisanae TaxID=880157 RepID=A0A0J5FXF8_9GAMM|nr:YdaS family helix-turn-helix protein [Xenorhabdus khoisanae]KMJ46924.1 XRE family transcriptional regulator [Xenorhabdus khoisanae]MDC9614922.1 YdaS family helix-turn-helix protein [Xenorhabdus khoisanae]
MRLNDYISTLKRGEAKRLAEKLGVSSSYLSQMAHGHAPVPLARCFDIENATDGKVTRKDLRPNDWQKIWPETDIS